MPIQQSSLSQTSSGRVPPSRGGAVKTVTVGDIAGGVKRLFKQADDKTELSDFMKKHPTAIRYRELETKETEPRAYVCSQLLTNAQYDAVLTALFAGLSESESKGQCELREQDRAAGTIEYAEATDKASGLFVDFEVSLQHDASTSGQSQVQLVMHASAPRQSAVAKPDIIKEFFRLKRLTVGATP